MKNERISLTGMSVIVGAALIICGIILYSQLWTVGVDVSGVAADVSALKADVAEVRAAVEELHERK